MRFTIERLERRIGEIRSRSERAVHQIAEVRTCPWVRRANPAGIPQDAAWEPIRPGDAWGEPEGHRWFAFEVAIPEAFAGFPVRLRPRLADRGRRYHYEALAYVDGVAAQGIDGPHESLLLASAAKPGKTHQVHILASTGAAPAPEVFVGAELVCEDPDAWELSWDLGTALASARTLDENAVERARILRLLEEAVLLVDYREPIGEAFYASCHAARDFLRDNLYGAMSAEDLPSVHVCGHSHIDVAWLWPLVETRHKSTRTFATMLALMDQFPDFHFTQSQPQLYRYLEEDDPAMFERIKARIADGRWEPTGGMWVEADCNVSSGEALVRQFLYGKRYFKKHFGVNCEMLWLPDVFGYSWALPQIMRRSGIKYFMTIKISWNQYNTMPHDSFLWQGIDGSRVLTHFITATDDWRARGTTYCGMLEPNQIHNAWKRYKQKDVHEEVLFAAGYGDGGGGPTREMMEMGQRLRDFPGMPKVTMGFAEDFFRRLEPKSDQLARWNGELYLEYHRGTYTTQAANKRSNRKSELLLRDAEFFASLGHLRGRAYPHATLDEAWELTLLNQFHDILPGSSINEVYVDSTEQYKRVAELGEKVVADQMAALVEEIDTSGEGRALVLFNSLSVPRADAVEVDAGDKPFELKAASGESVPFQTIGDGRIVLEAPTAPPLGWETVRVVPADAWPQFTSTVSADQTARTLENQYWTIEFDEAGHIRRLFDRCQGREVFPEGAKANLFRLFEDKPLNYDAWDIDIFYQDKSWPIDELAEFRVIEAGPVRAGFEIVRAFRASRIAQRVYVYANTPRIDFQTEVDWQERHLLLKVEFPVEVHTTAARYDIQYGNVERPNHWNTSWDWARFETCAHKWVDLSEGDYGVSLLNDCKYGHDVRDNVLRMTLLKGSTSPDPEADLGRHLFTYALLPHAGDFRTETVERAYELNIPMRAWVGEGSGGALPASHSLVTCSADHVFVEAVKKAEDSDALIVRVYEWSNRRGPVTLTFGTEVASAKETDLMEEPTESDVTARGQDVAFTIKPYEIRTFAVTLA